MGSPENNSKYETKESLNTNPLLESLKNEVNISVNEQKLFYITQVLEARKDELKYSKNASSLSFVDAPGKALRVQYIEQTLNELKNINSEGKSFMDALKIIFDSLKNEEKQLLETILESKNIKQIELKSLELIRKEDGTEQIENIFKKSFAQEIQIGIIKLRQDKSGQKQIEEKTRGYMVKHQADIYKQAIKEFEKNKEKYEKLGINW